MTKLFRSICPACDGFGRDKPAPGRPGFVVGVGCRRCNDSGVISLSTESARSLHKATLCEVCGVRSFGGCMAPPSWHRAHEEFTNLVSAGGVILNAASISLHWSHLWGRSVRYWSRKGREVTEAEVRASTTPEGWLLLHRDDAEDIQGTLEAERGSSAFFFTTALSVAQRVIQGLPLWKATLLGHVAEEYHKALLVNGYSSVEVVADADPTLSPTIARQLPAWLRTAWAHHWTTHYPKKEFGPNVGNHWTLVQSSEGIEDLPRNRAARRRRM